MWGKGGVDMEDMIPCSVKDQEVFHRVWQRVMEGRSEADSPVQPNFPSWGGDLSCECLESLMHQGGDGLPQECRRQEMTVQPMEPEPPMEPQPSGWQSVESSPAQEVPAQEPAEQAPIQEAPAPEPPSADSTPAEGLPEERGRHRGNDLPQLWDASQSADDRTARLRRHVMDALEGWQFYRHLAKRARGTDARTLNAMAGELHKEARKLAAAYFLLTGLRYWPTELLGAPAIPSYWGALRTHHQAEQRQENAYRLAADDWEDPDLLALYAELTEGCQRRCRQLRSLLEETVT